MEGALQGLLPLLIWGGLFFLMMRLGCGSHLFGHGRKRNHDHAGTGDPAPQRSEGLVWTAPEKDTDPVCGKGVETSMAKSSVYAGWVYYFCSRECREVFEAAPDQYAGPGVSNEIPRLEHTHA